MAAIAMPPYPDWSVKAAKNIGCWLCEHFQRYGPIESNGQEMRCEGECRKDPPRAGGYTKDLVKPADWPVDGYFTFIGAGNVAWCNGFQKSLEENIPASPGPAYTNCPHQDPLTWTTPDSIRTQDMPSKKPVEESCWYCDHFQRLYETIPGAPQDAAEYCKGYCCHAPQPDYKTQVGVVEDKDFTWQQFALFTKITYAPRTWCSRWERATQDVPDVPTGPGQIICQDSQPS